MPGSNSQQLRGVRYEFEAIYPDSTHLGLRDQTDTDIWTYAQKHNFVIVSKDGDFAGMAKLFGPPPAVIWLRFGNCTTKHASEALMRAPAELKGLIDQGVAMVEIHEGHGPEL